MRVALFNPMAGQRWRRRRVRAALDLLRAEPDTLVVETRAHDVTAQAREYVARGAREFVACGGDGTVCAVAAAIVGTDIPLRIVPCGTSNVLARELGIPRDPVRAVQATATASRASVLRDLCTWTLNEHSLVLGAGIGWDASLLRALPRAHKRRFGLAAMFVVGSWRALRHRYPSLRIDGVARDGTSVRVSGSGALITNVRGWGGHNAPFPDASPLDDMLDVIVCTPRNFLHLASFWSLVLLPGGRPLRLPGVERIRCTSLWVTLDGDTPADVHVNGEVIDSLTTTARTLQIAPSGMLRVRVP